MTLSGVESYVKPSNEKSCCCYTDIAQIVPICCVAHGNLSNTEICVTV